MHAVADPDLGEVLIYLPCWPFSLQSFLLFSPKIRGEGAGPLDLPLAWYGVVWCGNVIWYGMVWYGMVWYGMVWYGMVWYGMVWL